MITLFNRKELTITYDMTVLNKIRTILQSNNIEHQVKVTNTLSPSPFNSRNRARRSTIGIDLSKTHEYKIYVKKSDYDEALYLTDKLS